jgi:hypothetical protein
MSLLPSWVDERFLEHRRRSTSVAGIVAAELALLLFFYDDFIRHVLRWDLLAIGLTFVAVKLTMMAYFRFRR